MSQDATQPEAPSADEELARNVALFLEADRLEAHAYSLMEGDATSAVSWERFTEAKALADAKRTEAHQDLLRIRGQLIKSSVP